MNEPNHKGIRVSIGIISIGFLLVCQIVAFAFGYGMLIKQVAFNRELIQSYQTNQLSIMAKIDDLSTRVTRIEVILQTSDSTSYMK